MHVRTISRRRLLRASGLALAGAFVSACAAGARRATPTANRVEIVYQDWRTPWFPPMVRDLLEEFHRTHPHLQVHFVPDPVDLESRMLYDMQAGTAADVFQGCCTHFPAWAQSGYTLDLAPYVAADLDAATIADWDPAQYTALVTPDGLRFGLPKYHGALALYYNQDLFDQYSVPYPDGTWDHDDYRDAMLHLTDDRDGDGETDLWGSMMDVSWDRVQIHVNGWGGHLADPADPARCGMGDPEALEALEWLRARMWDDKVMATLPAVGRLSPAEAFVGGRVAMLEDGSWALKDILTRAPFRVGVAPFPAGPVRRVTLATTDGFGIYAGTRHPEEAWEFVRFLIGPEYGRAMARANLLQPARASLVADWIGYVREEFPEQAAEVDLDAFADGQRAGYSVTAEVLANMAPARELAQDAWDQVLTLGQEPIARIQEAAAAMQALQGGAS